MGRPADSVTRLTRVFTILFLVIAAIPLGLGGYFYVRTQRFVSSAERAEGTVVAMAGSQTQAPVVAFTDGTGTPHRITSSVSSSPPAHVVGEKVTVLYDPLDPGSARLDSFIQLWLGATVALGIGGMFLLMALAMAFLLPLVLRALSDVFAGRVGRRDPPPVPPHTGAGTQDRP